MSLEEIAVFSSIVIGFPLSMWVAYWIPGFVKRRHVKRNNALMERCRAEYLLAIAAMERGDRPAAAAKLQTIRAIERSWRRRRHFLNRFLLGVWALTLSAVAYVAVRQISLVLPLWFGGKSLLSLLQRSAEMLTTTGVAIFGLGGACWGLNSWIDTWTDPAIIDDCGDRLQRDLNSLRQMATSDGSAYRRHSRSHALTDYEIFGLAPGFTLKDLDRARRSLAARFHPDVTHVDRGFAEETMKLINAAYDRMKRHVAA